MAPYDATKHEHTLRIGMSVQLSTLHIACRPDTASGSRHPTQPAADTSGSSYVYRNPVPSYKATHRRSNCKTPAANRLLKWSA